MPPAVHVTEWHVTDAKGMALYTFDNDKEANKSACSGNCLNNWPVLKAEATDKDMGDWKVITRDDGSKQWAYKGKPLYYFAMDNAAGDSSARVAENGLASREAVISIVREIAEEAEG
jgi:predicted lipoprotein with Yx(FWY)xxD motif